MKTLHEQLAECLKDRNAWVPKAELLRVEWRDSKGNLAMPDNIGRRLREMECGRRSDVDNTPMPDTLRVAVKPWGKSHAYHYLPPNLIYKYITWVERKDKYVIWRTGAVKAKEYKQVGEIVGNVYRLRTIEV